jgi:hypothetical protein
MRFIDPSGKSEDISGSKEDPYKPLFPRRPNLTDIVFGSHLVGQYHRFLEILQTDMYVTIIINMSLLNN